MNKYHAIKSELDGIIFDSKREMRCYQDLKLREYAGEITNVEVHPAWDLVVNGVRIGKYTADFSFIENGALVVMDAKGVKTRDYILRKKLMKAIHQIEIVEV
jgi:hypothetical protein